jgi:hypothetical protein
LYNPDRILKKVWIDLPHLLDKFRLSFQNKSFGIFGQTYSCNSPQNSTGKSGVQICDARLGGSRGGLVRLDLVLEYS